MLGRISLVYGLVISGCCLLVLPLYYIWGGSHIKFTDSTLLAFVGICIIAAVLCVARQRSIRNITVSWIDIIFGGIIMWRFFNATFIAAPASADWFDIYKVCALGLLYIIVRNLSGKEAVIEAIIISGLFQAAVMLMQYLGFIQSNHFEFAIIGTFSNPGLLGGYLSMAFVLALGRFMRYVGRKRHEVTIYYFLSFLILAFALIVSCSRAAWLAALVGSICILCKRFRLAVPIKAGFAVLIITVIPLLYLLRPESADGRLLIWRGTWNMFCSSPLFGIGVGGFQREYMYYQADYFLNHPDSGFVKVADNVIYAFNEPLKIAAEQGIIGIVLHAALAFMLFRLYSKRKGCIVFPALFTFIVFSLFSYPSASVLFMLVPVMLLATIRTSKKYRLRIPSYGLYLFALGTLLLAGIAMNQYVVCREWSAKCVRSRQQIVMGQILDTGGGIFEEYNARPLLRNNHITSLLLLEAVPDTCFRENALSVYKHCFDIAPSSILSVDVGQQYEKVGDFDMAEKYYELAHNMNPDRITPSFRLLDLYRKAGCIREAKQIAERIMTTDYRIVSTEVLRMKALTKQFLEQNPPEN